MYKLQAENEVILFEYLSLAFFALANSIVSLCYFALLVVACTRANEKKKHKNTLNNM